MPRTSSSSTSIATARSSMFARDRDRIGQIEFPSCDCRRRSVPRIASACVAGERHQTAIAERDRALAVAGVVVLADGDEFVAFDDQPCRSRSDRAGRNPSTATAAPSRQRARAAARASPALISGVSAKTTRISSAPRAMRRLRRQHRMRGAAALALHEAFASGTTCRACRGDRILVGADHHRRCRAARLSDRARAHGRAANGRRSRAAPWAGPSACACPRRPQARSPGRFVSSIAILRVGAVIAERPVRGKRSKSRRASGNRNDRIC